MSMKIEKAAAEREPLAVDVLEHFEKLGGFAEAYRQRNPPEAAELQRTLDPLVNLAGAVRTEYAAYRERFAPILDRVAAIDLDALENFPGFGQISPLPSVARQLKRAIQAAIEDLDAVLGQAEAFARGERADVQLWDIQETVSRLEMALWQLPSDIRFLAARMGNFESSQPAPRGETVRSSLRHV